MRSGSGGGEGGRPVSREMRRNPGLIIIIMRYIQDIWSPTTMQRYYIVSTCFANHWLIPCITHLRRPRHPVSNAEIRFIPLKALRQFIVKSSCY